MTKRASIREVVCPACGRMALAPLAQVLEVQTLPKQERVRGRLADGWISLQNLGSGFRWAWPRKHQDAVTLKLGQMQSMQATLKEEDQEDLEAEADLLYLKALLSRASMGLPALKSFQSESPSKTWALFGRGLEQWDSVAGPCSQKLSKRNGLQQTLSSLFII